MSINAHETEVDVEAERGRMRIKLDKEYDNWNSKSRPELFLHSEYYQAPPGEVSGIDDGWDEIAESNVLWSALAEIDRRGIASTKDLAGEELKQAYESNQYIIGLVARIARERSTRAFARKDA